MHGQQKNIKKKNWSWDPQIKNHCYHSAFPCVCCVCCQPNKTL